jgi:CheY-like chemotaxis protein
MSILLVDDNEVNLKIASIMLRKLGYQADLVTNGIEAIQALEHRFYNIVLMDIQMPQMDGLEATKIIRQRWPHSPAIIVITSLSNYREACLEVGADDFLTKPIRIEKLKESIEHHIPIPTSNGLEEGEVIGIS